MSRIYLGIAGVLFVIVGLALIPVLTDYTANTGEIEASIFPFLLLLLGIVAILIAIFKKGDGS